MISHDSLCGEEKLPACRHHTRRRRPRALFPVLAVMALVTALPDAAAAVGLYAGLGVGLSNVTIAEPAVAFDVRDATATESAFRIFAGYCVGDHLRLEGGRVDLDKARVSEQVYGDFFETALTGFDLTAAGVLPLGRSLSAFARGGLLFWNADVTAEYENAGAMSRSASGSALALGLGLRYAIAGAFALRAEYLNCDIDDLEAGVEAAKPLLISGEYAF